MPLWRGDHVAVKQLAEDFARYLYLPRLKNPEVLLDAIRDGLVLLTWQQDSFAFADSYDEKHQPLQRPDQWSDLAGWRMQTRRVCW